MSKGIRGGGFDATYLARLDGVADRRATHADTTRRRLVARGIPLAPPPSIHLPVQLAGLDEFQLLCTGESWLAEQ